jgi:hypothetical protein
MSRDIGAPVTARTKQSGRQLETQSNTFEIADLTTMRKWKMIFVDGCERSSPIATAMESLNSCQPHSYEVTSVLGACPATVEISNTERCKDLQYGARKLTVNIA